MKRLALHWQILIAMALGIGLGLGLRAIGAGDGTGLGGGIYQALDIVGTVFVRLLKMLIIPLVLATMVNGVLSLGDFRHLGRLGGKTILYYVGTTAVSVITGLLLVNLLRPGVGADISGGQVIELHQGPATTVKDLILSMVPSNPVQAMANMDILGVIVFSLLFGMVLLRMGDKAQPLKDVFATLGEAMMTMTDWILRLAPFGVFALIATVLVEFGPEVLENLVKYVATVLIALGIHFFVSLPLIGWLLTRENPFRLMRDVSAALLTAFSSASSAATLPLTIECIEENAKVPRHYTGFVLPIGATINMDGTALYEAVAVVFIAQAYGIDLTVAQQVMIFVTATMAAIGAAAIPSAGLVTMAIVLRAVGLPLEGVALILGVDRFLDMCRTATNVWGDAVGTKVISKLDTRG